MRRSLTSLSVILLACAAPSAVAQVYRCGDSSVFTDRPCEGASAVDVRPNILDAGPRYTPDPVPATTPAPAIILQAPARPAAPSGSLWERRDAAESDYRSRTGPYRP